ncbi:MAG: glycoside hydrolase 43 family protein [Bacteroidota bacterium]
MKRIIILISLFALFNGADGFGQKTVSDNGDGTYTNPVIFADFPDPDVIRVDSVYYMVSTTMFVFPGVTILRSYDLVNWGYCSNAVQRMDFSPCYNLDGCHRYGHGQWATSLKYHDGKYYLLFITLDEGGFLCSADVPEGPWDLRKLPAGFYDPGLFFDDDGKIYVAHGYGDIKITELKSDFSPAGEDVLVFKGDIRPGLEGTHVYKRNGYYYLYCTYGGWDGFQVALRAGNIYGPYEEKIVIRDKGNLQSGIHQGALVQTPAGEWWSVIFQDGGPMGRFPTLQPVQWTDDWPMVGIGGKGVDTWTKPHTGKVVQAKALPTSDEFDREDLGMQWGWNHNPDPDSWSLNDRPGFLRLRTASLTGDFRFARNTLTQRIIVSHSREYASLGSCCLDPGNMKEGDIAGLAVFQDPYAYVAVKSEASGYSLIMVNNGLTTDSVSFIGGPVYLKAKAAFLTGKATFWYSLDNKDFQQIGDELEMKFNLSVFTGNKFCLFNYATHSTGGFADFDWFRTAYSGEGEPGAK